MCVWRLIERAWYNDTVTVLAEANKAFEFNSGLFACLKPPSRPPSPPTSPLGVEHHLGDPLSPAKPKFNYPLQLPGQPSEEEEQAAAGGEGLYSVQGVVSFIVAMCLAHFVLVVGGFTGERGWDKYVKAHELIGALRERIMG